MLFAEGISNFIDFIVAILPPIRDEVTYVVGISD